MSFIPLNRVKRNNKVDLWDLGPTRPDAPKAPEAPDPIKLKGPDLAEAEVEYEDAMERYKKELREFSAAKKGHADWHKNMGGPIKVELWGCDARDAMKIEPKRYVLDLPKDKKPGRAQIEAEEMALQEADAAQRAGAADPQFGGQVGAMT